MINLTWQFRGRFANGSALEWGAGKIALPRTYVFPLTPLSAIGDGRKENIRLNEYHQLEHPYLR